MNKIILATIAVAALTFSGCGRIDPLSPRLNQDLQNQNGKIEELKNNQNGLLLELGKLRNENAMMAQTIKDAQQGIINLKGQQNSGIQFFSGDGGMILFFGLAVMGFLFIYHYRERAVKSEQTAQILAQQITLADNPELESQVFLSALNTNVEADVYHLMVKSQRMAGKRSES